MTRLRVIPLGVLGVVLAVSASQAATVPLSDLLNGETFTSGDKVFSNFTYNITEDMPAADAVTVTDIRDADGNYGIRFQGGFIDRAGGTSSDALITFDVSVAPGVDRVISDAHLAANPAVFNGEGVASVTETFPPIH